MEVTIKNCNSIDETKIQIEPGRLNVKYGVNGTGKSTIVKAIELSIPGNNGDLSVLTPFKHLGKPGNEKQSPCIEGLQDIQSVFIFNEDYVNQFVFRQDELVANSFEIFIKTEGYIKKMEEIDKLVSNIKNTFKQDARLEQVIKDLTELGNSFGKPAKEGLHGSAPINKAFGKSGNKIQNVPQQLKAYTPFLTSEHNVKWIDWQIRGNDFLGISHDCPYCTSPTNEKTEIIKAVSQEYDKKSIEHLNKITTAIKGLGKYFSADTNAKINTVVSTVNGLSKEQESFLKNVWNDVNTLKEKLSDLKDISFFSLKNDENIEKNVEQLKIDLNLLPHMNSTESESIVNAVNQSLDDVIQNIGHLKGQINQQKAQIKKTIKEHKTDIDNFLRYAGYRYFVDIEEDNETYKMRLKHNDSNSNVSNSSRHLSFGERNAFALVLFMYESLSKKPDLIVLDDPISSFDKHKKFAIIEMLFKRKGSLKGKTVLMMTHDFEPIVDMLSTLRRNFQPSPCASFLSNRQGIVKEIQIEQNDILSFGNVCTQNLKGATSIIVKLVHLRRYYEIMNNKGNEYNILSSLLHKRTIPSFHNSDGASPPTEQNMTEEDINNGTQSILKELKDFNYSSILAMLNDEAEMISLYHSTDNYYEKLQLYTVINDENRHESDIIQKFINETFHIENEYVMQLNPLKYDFIPEYIIEECNKVLQPLSSEFAA